MPVTESQGVPDLKRSVNEDIPKLEGRNIHNVFKENVILKNDPMDVSDDGMDISSVSSCEKNIASNVFDDEIITNDDETNNTNNANNTNIISNNGNTANNTKTVHQRESKISLNKSTRLEPSSSHSFRSKYSLDYFDAYNYQVRNHNKVPRFMNSYLRSNAVYVGEQQSGKSRFHIKVELKSIDLMNLVVTGFLQISGLTEDHSEIITCFKGEIINNPMNTYLWQDREKKSPNDYKVRNFSFITENKQWGSFIKNDFEHWKKLTGSSTLSDEQFQQRLERILRGEEDQQYLYMRWKEEFLLPDSRIKQILGASFEGFYYIVMNIGSEDHVNYSAPYVHSTTISPGSISGLYYHKSSEKFQSLSLRYVEDRGVSNTFQFY